MSGTRPAMVLREAVRAIAADRGLTGGVDELRETGRVRHFLAIGVCVGAAVAVAGGLGQSWRADAQCDGDGDDDETHGLFLG